VGVRVAGFSNHNKITLLVQIGHDIQDWNKSRQLGISLTLLILSGTDCGVHRHKTMAGRRPAMTPNPYDSFGA